MRQLLTRLVTRISVLSCLLAGTGPAQAQIAPAVPSLPAWESLQLEQESVWLTASSQLQLDNCEAPQVAGLWCLKISSRAGSSREVLTLRFDPASGALHSRTRFSQGKQQRQKHWQYEEQYILRERRNPADDSGENAGKPADWPVSSRRQLSYPSGEHAITDSQLLLLLASPSWQAYTGGDFIIQTDLNFYRVTRRPAGSETLAANYRIGDARPAAASERRVMLIELQAQALGELQDKADFSMFGLSGRIIIGYDSDTGLPLFLRGEAPLLGAVEIKLRAMSPRVSPS
ncbi:MAG: hypothetical protein ABJ308_07740 [Halieaceae bacterium]